MDARPADRTEQRRGLLAHFGDFVRWLCFLLLLTGAAILGVLYVIQARLDEEIRAHIEGKFQANYPGLIVTLNSARRLTGLGIELRGLSVMDPADPTAPLQLAFVDELLIHCNTSLSELIRGRANAERIIVRRAKVQATRQPNGSWNTSRLWPLPKFGEAAPPVRIESGVVEVFDEHRSQPQSWKFHGIQLDVSPQPAANGPSPLRITGQLASRRCRKLELDGLLDPRTMQWQVSGTAQELTVSSEIMGLIPEQRNRHFELVRALRGTAQLGFRASGASPPAGPSTIQYSVRGLFKGQLQEARLPWPVRDIEAGFECENGSLMLERFTAQVGQTKLTANGATAAGGFDAGCQVNVGAEGLVLDDLLKSVLPPRFQDAWNKFDPRGIVDARLQLTWDGQRWTNDLDVVCRNVSFAFHKFPYRLTDARGAISFRQGVLRIPQVEARASNSRVRVSADIVNPGRDFTGWLEVSVEEPVPIDDRLIDALPQKNQHVVRSLDPRGDVTFWNRYERALQSEQPQCQLKVGLWDCRINYEGFRYPVHGISGTLEMRNDHWSFSGLQGMNDSGLIVCDGGWAPRAAGGGLWLDFRATDVRLDDELHAALNGKAQEVWNSLRLRGTLDLLNIAVRQSPAAGLSLDIAAHQRPPSQNVEGRSISVKPSWLPYQLDDVIGSVRFQEGLVLLQNLRGRHGETNVALKGQVEFGDQGWRVTLPQLYVDRLLPTKDFVSALPAELGGAVGKLNLSGPIRMNGSLELSGRNGRQSPDQAEWQLAFDLENGSVDCGIRLEHIHGEVALQGVLGPRGFHSDGMLNIDSLMYQGIQITDLRGPLSINRARVGFGQWSDSRLANQPPPRPILASSVGGTLTGNGEFNMSDAHYELQATLRDADLLTISREVTNSKLDLTGNTFASVHLHGFASGFHTLRGEGKVRLRQADIYQLPLMITLLKLLRFQPPDETAFTSSDLSFRVEDDIIYFDKILFEGDAISLDGRGEMNFKKVMNLTFATSVGRDDGQVLSVLVRPFLKEAGRRLMELRVTGSLDDPQITRLPFPDVIPQVFPTSGDSARPVVSRLPTPREFFDQLKPQP